MQNYQLHISLMRIEPPIWRRIAVPGSVTLAKLHNIIQIVMGWENYHIYLFKAAGQQFGEGMAEWSEVGQRVLNARRITLPEIVRGKGSKCSYTYDIGDGWEHEIRVEAVEEGPPAKVRCLEGARSCPPEDCGGPHGYGKLLEIIFDPKHPQYEEKRDWLGGGFGPERFDCEAVNRRLGRIKVRTEAA
jgi:hypothetical protein